MRIFKSLVLYCVALVLPLALISGCGGGGGGGGSSSNPAGNGSDYPAQRVVLNAVVPPILSAIEAMGGEIGSSMRASLLGNTQENADLNSVKNAINTTMDVNNLLNILAAVAPTITGGLINTENNDEYQWTEATYEGNVLTVKRYKKGFATNDQKYVSGEMKIENCSATLNGGALTALTLNNGAVVTLKYDKRSSDLVGWQPIVYETKKKYVASAKITVKGGITVKLSSDAPVNVVGDKYFDWNGVETSLDNAYSALKGETTQKETTTLTLSNNLEFIVSDVIFNDGTVNHGSANIKITGISGDYIQIADKVNGKWLYRQYVDNYTELTDENGSELISSNFTAAQILEAASLFINDSEKPERGYAKQYTNAENEEVSISWYDWDDDYYYYYYYEDYPFYIDRVSQESKPIHLNISNYNYNYNSVSVVLYNNKVYVNKHDSFLVWTESQYGPTEVTRNTDNYNYIKLDSKVDVEVTGKWNEKGLEIKKLKTSLSGITALDNPGYRFKKYNVSNASVEVEIGNSSYKLDDTYQNLQVKSAKVNITGLKFNYDNPLSFYENAKVKLEAESLSGMKIGFNTDLKTNKAHISLANLFPVTDPKNDKLTFNFKSALVTATAPGSSFGVSNWNNRFEGTTFQLAAVENDGKITQRTYKMSGGKLILQAGSQDKVPVDTELDKIPDAPTSAPAGYETKPVADATCFVSTDKKKATMKHENKSKGVESNVKLLNTAGVFSGKSDSMLNRTPYSINFTILPGTTFTITGKIGELEFTVWGTKEHFDIQIN